MVKRCPWYYAQDSIWLSAKLRGKIMPEKDPTSWGLATWALALGMALAGGFVNWYTDARRSRPRAFSVVEFLGGFFSSGFVGLGSFMVAEALGQPIGLCAAAAGIGGHMATRLLFSIERAIERKLNSQRPEGSK